MNNDPGPWGNREKRPTERKPAPQGRGYWAQMPLYMKFLAPVTALLVVIGVIYDRAGAPEGEALLTLVAAVLIVRILLKAWFMVGPPTIFGYSFVYFYSAAEARYSLVRYIIPLMLLAFFVWYVLISDEPTHG